jgi:micrococcal nuclease
LIGRVTRVTDGDTITVTTPDVPKLTVRIIGVDTPETRDPRKPVQCYGPESSERAKRLLNGATVRLVDDPTQSLVDRYSRDLRYVEVRSHDGSYVDYGRSTLADGYGRVYVYQNDRFERAGDYDSAQRSSKQGQLGLWGPPCNGGL